MQLRQVPEPATLALFGIGFCEPLGMVETAERR